MTMKFTSTVFFVIASLASSGISYPVQKADTVNCRAGPSTNYGVSRSYSKGADIQINCQEAGQTIYGNSIWDKTQHGCYIADYYVKTDKDGYVAQKCSSNSPGGDTSDAGKVPGLMKDDYPYKGNCYGNGHVDKWRYYRCNCTSFVAWRINSRLGITFNNMYKGTNWGDGRTWADAARRTGVKVDSVPKPGAVAHANPTHNHVAWVAKVSGSMVTVEEYNWNNKLAYGVRTVPKSTFDYIHLK